MSKSTLKKELEKMTREQLQQIILDAYDARKETKEYLEFFLNPDIEKQLEKHILIVNKELQRSKWGRSKARVTVMKQAVQNFISLNPGPEAVADMLMLTLRQLGFYEKMADFQPTQIRFIQWIVSRLIAHGDEHQMALELRARIEAVANLDFMSRFFRRTVSDALETV